MVRERTITNKFEVEVKFHDGAGIIPWALEASLLAFLDQRVGEQSEHYFVTFDIPPDKPNQIFAVAFFGGIEEKPFLLELHRWLNRTKISFRGNVTIFSNEKRVEYEVAA